MESIKTVFATIVLSIATFFWILFSANSFTNFIGDFNFLYLVLYIVTIFFFWGMWIMIGTRYLK